MNAATATAKKAAEPAKKPKNAPLAAAKPAGLGLGDMGDLSALLGAPVANDAPREFEIDLIDEDPNQPRTEDNPGFSKESLGELAESIKLRGVKTPISLRENPESPGRFLINHGARRFRSSKLAEKSTIPGFLDNDYNTADQVVENLQRNELTAREIADYIGRELAKGVKKGEIAKAISKSPAFITQHAALLDLPDPIAEVFNAGRVRDVTLVNELVTAHKKKPEEVADWLADEEQEITRGSVKLLREFLDDKRPAPGAEDEGGQQPPEGSGEAPEGGQAKDAKGEKAGDPEKLKKAIVQVMHDDRPARLLLNRRPPAEGFAWLKYDDDGKEFEASLAQVKLIAVIEA